MYHTHSTYQSRPYATSHAAYSSLGAVVVSTPQQAVAYATTSPISAAGGATAYVSSYDHLYGGTAFHQTSDASYYSGASYQSHPTYQTTPKTGGSNQVMEAALQSAALGALQNKASTFKNSYNRFTAEGAATKSTPSFSRPMSAVRPNSSTPYDKRMNPSAIRHRIGESIFYCDICRISCASQMTFKEHQDGQKHKRKEAQLAEAKLPQKTKSSLAGNPAAQQYLCELCNVTCTGTDAYQAHIKGKAHGKTARLHQKMGKPVPECKPVLVNTSPAKSADEKQPAPSTSNAKTAVTATPRPESATEGTGQAVGVDYVIEELNSAGKLVNYFCELCDCRFNDAVAKDMHTKGRRHRLQYKKKVDPSLEVDLRTLPGKERRVLQQLSDKLRKEKELTLQRLALQQFGPRPLMSGHIFQRRDRVHSVVDRYVMQKHADIIITEDEVKEATDLLVAAGNALRCVCEELDVDGNVVVSKTQPEASETPEETSASKEQETTTKIEALEQTKRAIRGVCRVGLFPKQLLLSGDQTIELVVLLAHKPTKSLVSTVLQRLQTHLQESYQACLDKVIDSQINVTHVDNSTMSCNIYLTAMEARYSVEEEDTGEKPLDLVPIEQCLSALALQRQMKWFDAKIAVKPRCLVIIRILRDLCARVDTWSHLSEWVIEILVERAVNSLVTPLSPGGALRRVFECLASGILLPGGPGLHDPCEKGNIDATAYLTLQQKEDITASAQHALRLIAFGFIHKVLDMEPLPEPTMDDDRKRRYSETEATGEDENAEEVEKDEEEPKKLALEADVKQN